jgi:hypothetical protein
MSVLTFDWNQITWIGSPLMVPWWAQVHVMFGFVLFYWILTPILYYTNVRDPSRAPFYFLLTGTVNPGMGTISLSYLRQWAI